MEPNAFTESQRKLFFQLQNSAQEEESAPRPTRAQRLAFVKGQLTRLHDGGDPQSLAEAYQEWSDSCAEFETEELLDVVDNVYQAAKRAAAQGRSYNFSAQLAYSLMVWLDGALADIEAEDGDEAHQRSDHQRFLSIFEASDGYFLAMIQHQDALEAEAAG